MELIVLCVSFSVLLLLGVPVAFSIGLSSLATMAAAGLPLAVVFQKMVGNFTHRMCRLIGDSIFLRSMQNYLNLK